MTADEKNHVISNANDELDRQLLRLDTVFPYIAGEISDEARLGSLGHWAYSNRNAAAKAAANERPRREAASNKDIVHAIQEAEAASRSEARREAVMARRQRRAHGESDLDEVRAAGGRKGQSSKARAAAAGDASAVGNAHATTGTSGQPKRRKVERPAPADAATAMERSASGNVSRTGTKEGPDGAKKRSRAPNTNTAAARKRYGDSEAKKETESTGEGPLWLTWFKEQHRGLDHGVTYFGAVTGCRCCCHPTKRSQSRTSSPGSTTAVITDSTKYQPAGQWPPKTLVVGLESCQQQQYVYCLRVQFCFAYG